MPTEQQIAKIRASERGPIAGAAEETVQRAADRGADVAAGPGEGGPPGVQSREPLGEVGERGHEHREQHDGEERPAGAAPGAPGDQREAGDHERRREQVLPPADPVGGVTGEVVAREAEEVEVDAEGDEHPEDHQRPAPDLVGLAADEGDDALGARRALGCLLGRGAGAPGRGVDFTGRLCAP